MDFGFKKVLTTTNQLLACMRLCQEGHMVSGYSCYDSRHKIVMGIVVLLTRNPQLSKSISVVDKIANSY